MPKQTCQPLSEDMFTEYRLAKKEKRQPRCVHCGQPLDEIRQTQYVDVRWRWDAEAGGYRKDDSDGDADPPFCFYCGVRDWDLVDFETVDD